LLGCKLILKCRKEEVLTSIIVVAMQCVKGSSMRWSPYLFNSFLEDYKDTQDWGFEFHYSCLLILIALVGWKEPTYSLFFPRKGKCGTMHYMSLQSTTYPKENKINNDVFSLYLREI
jgi:hypothetical protein